MTQKLKWRGVHYSLALNVALCIAGTFGWLRARNELERLAVQQPELPATAQSDRNRDSRDLAQVETPSTLSPQETVPAAVESLTPLTEGAVEIYSGRGTNSVKLRNQQTKYGPSEVALIKVWSREKDRDIFGSAFQWIEKKTGESCDHPLFVKIDGTPYELLISKNRLTPFLLVNNHSELWKLDGLAEYFEHAGFIESGQKKVTLALWLGDAHSRLTLDFRLGCEIFYDEGFHGP